MGTSKDDTSVVQTVHIKNKQLGGLNLPKSKKLIAGLILGAILIFSVVMYLSRDSKVNPSKDLSGINKLSDKGAVVSQYSLDYARTSQDIKNSSVSSWDKTAVDKAYFNLLYADKIGAYTEVQNTLFLIQSAGRSGVNIDDNSYGIYQAGRDKIKQRSEVKKAKVTTDE